MANLDQENVFHATFCAELGYDFGIFSAGDYPTFEEAKSNLLEAASSHDVLEFYWGTVKDTTTGEIVYEI